MKIIETAVVLELTPDEHADKKNLIAEYIHEKECQGFHRTGGKIRFAFDANYNLFYVRLKFERP